MIQAPLTTSLPTLTQLGMIDFDRTVFVSAGIFLILIPVLHALLFSPYLAILKERDRLTTGARDAAGATSAEAKRVLAEYEAQLQAARDEAAAAREALRASGEADESRIVGAAREQAERGLAGRRQTLATSVASAEAQIEQRSATLAQAIVAKVLA
ncbi:MAG: ATP synthase F0 subunit B [Myxococcales bacterium]|nr:ATP synthase F0 subunit B [Myxococcales bacterium]MCB9532050.1 ATP synthase F0 subunit B [Myxococcales bacterium]